MAFAANAQGNMVLALEIQTEPGDGIESTLAFSTRRLNLVLEEPTDSGIATQTMPAPTLPAPSPTLNSETITTAVIDAQPTDSQSTAGQDEAGNQLSPYLIAIVPVALLLLTVLAIVIRRTVKNKDA